MVLEPLSISEPKPLTHAERGQRGAASRWSDPANRRIARLDALTPPQRAVVLAMVAAAEAAKAAEE
jgi:hypothetical protein